LKDLNESFKQLDAFNDLWRVRASGPAKITAGKKPARGCCEAVDCVGAALGRFPL